MKLIRLHRRSEALMTLTAVIAFISGAGLDAPSVLPALALLIGVVLWEPSTALRKRLDPIWKILAVLLAVRAVAHVILSPEDIVLSMVDLLLVLLVAEVFRVRDTGNDARVYALTFALLVASAAYRPGAVFALAFVAYMAAATVSLMVGHLLHTIEKKPIRDVSLRPRFLMQSAAFSGIALFTSALVFLIFPRVTRGWVSRGLPLAQSVMGFSDRVSLTDHGGQIYPNPQLVLRVEFPDGPPPNLSSLHWRGLAYDRFTGYEWMRSPGLFQQQGSDTARIPSHIIAQHIFGADLPDVSVLFGLHRVVQMRPDDYRFAPRRQPNGDFVYIGSGPPVYTVYSDVSTPAPQALAADSGAVVPQVNAYLQLPRLSPRILALADSLARGTVTTSDKVIAVQNYLRPFRYTLVLPASAREATLDYFLFNRRQGHCEYFSTAMAVLLRAMGVPTRNVNGFLGGEWNEFGKFMNVTQNQAHSWVEVWYPRYGWIQYDPTPALLSGLATNVSWFKPLRQFFDGLDYKWNRWVLEYDIKTQLSMFNKVADAFRKTPGANSASPKKGNPLRWGIAAFLLLMVYAFLRRGKRVAGSGVAPRESAVYLRVRRIYEKRGYPAAPGLAPLAFADTIASNNAPGMEDARAVIALYLRARFGGETLAQDEIESMRRAADRVNVAFTNVR